MQIQQATQENVPDIVKFSHALFQEDAGQRDNTMNLNWACEQGQAYFAHFIEKVQNICLLAIVDDDPVGYLAGYVRDASDLRLVKTAELESMFIHNAYRNQGVGKALVHSFSQWARENGAVSITVTAYSANEPAVKFYKSLGFSPKQVTLSHKL